MIVCVANTLKRLCLPMESPLWRTWSVLGDERHPEYLARGGAEHLPMSF